MRRCSSPFGLRKIGEYATEDDLLRAVRSCELALKSCVAVRVEDRFHLFVYLPDHEVGECSIRFFYDEGIYVDSFKVAVYCLYRPGTAVEFSPVDGRALVVEYV